MCRRGNLRTVATCVLLALAAGGPLPAQSIFGTILGAVTDPKGVVVPGSRATPSVQHRPLRGTRPRPSSATPAATLLEGPGFWRFSTSLTNRVRFREQPGLWLTLAAMDVFNPPSFRSPASSGELTVGHPALGSTSALLTTDRAADRARARALWLRARILF